MRLLLAAAELGQNNAPMLLLAKTHFLLHTYFACVDNNDKTLTASENCSMN